MEPQPGPGPDAVRDHTYGQAQSSAAGQPTQPSGQPVPPPPTPPRPPLHRETATSQSAFDPGLVIGLTPEDTDPGASARRSAVERLGRHAWAVVGIGLALYGVAIALGYLTWLVAPVVVAVVLSVLAVPIVDAIVRLHLPRGIATLAAFLVIVLVIVTFFWVVGPVFTRQVGQLGADLPSIAQGLGKRLDDFQRRVSGTSPAAGRAVDEFRRSLVQRSQALGRNLASDILGLAGSVLGLVGAFLIGLVVSIMVVKDLPKLTRRLTGRLGRPEYLRARGAATAARRTTTGFIRGQLLVAFIVGCLKTLVMWLLGIEFYAPLGVLSGIANLVPGIGPLAAGIPPVLIALGKSGIGWALLTAGALGVVQLSAIWLWNPLLVRTTHQLPTLVVIVALILGAAIAGLGGLVIAVPVAATIREVLHWYALPDEALADELAKAESVRAVRRSSRGDVTRAAV